MKVSIVVGIGNNREIGLGNKLLWHLSEDLKRFKKITMGHHMIMGRKTFESLGKPLPNRTTIIISRNKDYQVEGCIIVNSLEKAIMAAKEDANPYILGGGEIYRQALDHADILDLTVVHHSFEDADTFFPPIDFKKWKEISREDFKADETHDFDYSFVTYKKK